MRVVLQRGGEQLFERDVHHHAPHHAEERAVGDVGHGVAVQHQVAEQTADGLVIRYDPKLRDTFNAADNNAPSLWPFFDALDGLPIALIRGMNSDLLSVETADEMSKRRPDMIRAEVPDRGHVPFLDEAEAIEALRAWLSAVKDTQA